MFEIDGEIFETYDFMDIDQEMYCGYVYVTINQINGKKYIGRHTRWIKKYVGSGIRLRQAINKYGIENFETYIIDLAIYKNELKVKEEFYITYFKAHERDDWYNISKVSSGGNTLAGYTPEEMHEFRRKISNAFKNMPKKKREDWLKNVRANHKALKGKENGMFGSARFGEKNPMYGKRHTEESKRKNSESNKGNEFFQNCFSFH
ncbi:NUMOD3 domain-containing DNA-binding protein [Peribacillus sp. SCS-155]|uniref:NUMOD3 domain-containing DNA-binding protein n=1 Tax=Peribacillus sedimenti TaxID=3115297 RepID=UPI003906D014